MRPSLPVTLAAIHDQLTTQVVGRRIELHQRIASTNREAFALAQRGAEHGTVVVAEEQTEGRGRLGRKWFSPPGVNLYCSVVIRKDLPHDRVTEWLSWLPLSAAVAGANAIEAIGRVNVAVKWPNDLLIEDRKVGGILGESGTATSSGPFQVVGIGINVNGSRGDFPRDLQDSSTSIGDETGRAVDRNTLLCRLLLEVEQCIEDLAANGYCNLGISYRRRCATLGQTVHASLANGSEFVGIAQGIASDGSLEIVERAIPLGHPPHRVSVRAADIIHLRS